MLDTKNGGVAPAASKMEDGQAVTPPISDLTSTLSNLSDESCTQGHDTTAPSRAQRYQQFQSRLWEAWTSARLFREVQQ